MELHEKNCLKNPANKSCMTCPNQVYGKDFNPDDGMYHYRGCKLAIMNEFIESVHHDLELKGTPACHVKPLVHCPNWGLDKEVPWTKGHLNDIRPKIEAAAAERRRAEDGAPAF